MGIPAKTWTRSRVFSKSSITKSKSEHTLLLTCIFKFRGEKIVSVNEDVDMFAIILYGTIRVGDKSELSASDKARGEKIHYLKIGDMFGQ